MARNILLSTIVLLGLQTVAFGQNVTLSLGSTTGTAGGTVVLPINLTSAGGAQTSGLQWTFTYSSDITGVTVAAGSSSTAAGKSVTCNGIGNPCIVAGFNSTVIPDGPVATATFQISAAPSNNPITIQLSGVVASTASGTSIPSSGVSGSITLPVSVSFSTLNCSPLTINTPGTNSCTVSLNGTAPAGGFPISLSSNNTNLTVPSSVTVAAGQTSNSFTATGAQVSANQSGIVTASAGGVNLTNTISLVAPAQLSSLACAPSTLGSNASSSCTVTLTKAATSATTVALASNNPLLTVPASVVVASGQGSATFTATSGTVSSSQSATVTATLNGQSQPATISLAAAAQLSSLSCSPGTVNAPGTSTCTVTLTAATVSAASVTLSSNNASITVPATVNIGAGLSSATFTASVASVTSDQTAILTSTLNGSSKTFTLTGSAPAQLSSLACAPTTLGSNSSSTCTAALSKTATSAATVTLASNNGLLTVPASVVVASGQSSAIFTAASGTVSSTQNATVTATLSGVNKQSVISLVAALQPSSLTCSPAIVNAPGTSLCTVTLTGAASSALTVTLSSNNASVTVPGSINIGTGMNSGTFTATAAAVTSDQAALLTATLNGASQTFTVTASAPAQLSSLACAPSTLGSNASSTCTVTLNKAASSAATVALASNNALLTVAASVVVASGQSSATFAAASGTVSSSQSATVTATLSGQSRQAVISLTAVTQLSSLACAPGTVSSPGTTICSVTLTAATSSAATVALQSNNTSVTVPSSVNIGSGLTGATFSTSVAAVVSNQTAVLTATMNGVSRTFTLTATGNAPAQLSSLSCSPSTLASNAASTCTVALNTPATSTAIVSIVSGNVMLSVPTSVAIVSGQSSATFAATSGTIGSGQNATVTATMSGVSQQAAISLMAPSQLSSLTCAPASVIGPGTSLCTVTMGAAPANTVSVALASNNTSVSVPASVNIGAGQSSATFSATVAAVTSSQSALLTATLSGVSKTFSVTAAAAAQSQLTSLTCTPAALASNLSTTCTVKLSAAATSAAIVSLASNNGLLSVPANVTVPVGQSAATFSANSGSVSSSQNVTVTAALNGQSQTAVISLAASVNCQEFQNSPGGLCMVQDVLPWITFGGGWESRLSAANLTKGSSGGTIQFSFTLLPAVPATGGIQNHMPAFFTVNKSRQSQVAETGTYSLSPGKSILLDFLAPPAGCDSHGQNCGSAQDLNTTDYGSILVQYVADNPAYLRGIAKAQLTLLANSSTGTYGWQTTEHEMSAANLWTAPVSVSANQSVNPQTSQQASAALANPSAAPITVRGTLYAGSGQTATFRDFQVPPLGAVAMVFSQDPNVAFGGFGSAMFPGGQDFNGLVTFQVISPNGGAVSAMVLQYVGTAMSSVEVNSQGTNPAGASTLTSLTRCAEFPMAPDGTCTAQYTLPWVAFGAGWESRLKAANPPSTTAGAVQFRFTLLPATPTASGAQNHLPAYYTDTRSGQLQVGETATYTLNAGQSVDVDFLNPPASCDIHGQNCASQPDPTTFAFGSVMVQFSSTDPANLRRLAYPQLAFLTQSNDSYSSQITEQGAAAATTWTAPVTMSANQGADPANNLAASAAIANPGTSPVTVRGTLLDQNGNIVTYNDFQVPALGAIGVVFAWDPSLPEGGFGSAAFPQGQDFSGWVTFNVTTPGSNGVNVVVLQYVGNTMSSVNVQSLP